MLSDPRSAAGATVVGGPPAAIGAMRLSTAPTRDDAQAAAVLDAALAAGVALIDTADAYALDAADEGHNERLIARAVARHAAAHPTAPLVRVVTKGGLRRDGGRWISDGRAAHLAAAARASQVRLGGGPLDTYLLHAPDPDVPFATSVRALARLVDDGVARRVGVSNVGRAQLEAALAITAVAAVEVELGVHDLDAIRGGLVACCAERGIAVLAHRPLGGPKGAARLARDAVLAAIAARHAATVAEVVLAWLRGLAPVIVPLPGPSTVATAVSAARAAALVLDDDARAALDAQLLGHGARRRIVAVPGAIAPRADGREVVIVMGMPGAGKSTLATDLVARGHVRFNRDERGGTLAALADALDAALAGGVASAVLDNTYPTRASRAPVIDVAARHGLPVRCVWLDTSIEDAQVNAAARLLARYDRLPEPGELGRLAKRDPGAFRPTAQFGWRRELEPPTVDEGLTAVAHVPFVRGAAPAAGDRRALIVDLARVPDHAVALRAWAAAGWTLAATAWQPALGDGTAAAVAAATDHAAALLGLPLEVATCAHGAGPPVCWCRKPLPGLGLVLARRLGLDLGRSVLAGDGAADRGFAARLGLRFVDVAALVAPPPAVD